MADELPIFAQRLTAALAARSPEQEAALLAAAKSLGAGAGFHAAVAAVAGISGPSVLSDILGGRTSGARYQEALALAVGVDVRWLRGEADAQVPDWTLAHLAAYRRWKAGVQAAWTLRLGRPGRPGGEEDSRRPARGALDQESALARLLDHPPGHPLLRSLASGAWHAVPFADLVRFAAALGLREPTHPGHLASGHALSAELEQAIAEERASLQRTLARFALPPRLFQLTRMALVGLKGQRLYQDKDARSVDDALEVLWRHQAAALGQEKRDVLPAFTTETGRTTWTPLRDLHQRHAGPAEEVWERYDSRP